MHLGIGEEAEQNGVMNDDPIACGEAGEIDGDDVFGTLGALNRALNRAPNSALIRGCLEPTPERIGIVRLVILPFLIIYVFAIVAVTVGGRREFCHRRRGRRYGRAHARISTLRHDSAP
jgi:hypothetical protein